MKHSLPLLVTLLASLPVLSPAQQAVPESPAIWREVTGVVNNYSTGTAVPTFTRPHIPGYRTTADGRVASTVEGSGPDGSVPRFVLYVPEKMTLPFLKSAASSYTVSTAITGTTVERINVLNSFGDPALGYKNYTLNSAGVSHVCLYDPGANPTVVNGEDVYNVFVFITSNSGTSPANQTQFFITPIQITVSNPKTASAAIRLIAKTGATTGSGIFTGFNGSAFEPVICGDGRLLITRVGSGNFTWTDPITGSAHGPQGVDMVYSYYTGGAICDATKWTNLIPITHAPYDTRINTQFGFAMAPFRDAEGTLLPDGKDLGGSYPWIDREAKNLFFETMFDQLHYFSSSDNTYNHSRYPQTPVPEDPADYLQGEDGGKHQGVSFVGLWSHGKIVTIDNLNNDVDYAVGQGDTAASTDPNPVTGPQERMVNLYQANSGPLGNESGWLRMGYGRATRKMPAGENDNGNIIDSIQNMLNYRNYILPISLRDVAWLVSDSKNADELSFDDYVDPDALIVCEMSNLITFPATTGTSMNNFKSWSGWDSVNHVFNGAVKLQNAATSTSDRWITPKNGLLLGHGRIEPAASGGIHGKGFWLDGTIGLEFTIDAQPQNVASKTWYTGIFVDSRFANDTTDRRLLTYPDGSSIHLYGRSQVLYANPSGVVVHRITVPPIDTTTPASAMDDLLPDTGWAHLAFQVQKSGTLVDFYLNGVLFNRYEDDFHTLFQLTPGKLTVGLPSGATGVTGFSGWIDDFKVFAHAVDFETACNHAGGTLIGLPSTYTGVWKTKFASRYPAWVQAEISSHLANNGKTTYPLYANFYDFKNDNSANRFNIPSGTVSLRQNIHFPEGPLFYNAPRPDSATNSFCVSCHQPGGDGGLDPGALTLNTAKTTSTDPRRQPFQAPALIYGRIPAGLVDSTGLPTATTDLGAGGGSIDQWILPGYANNAAAQNFTVLDATTHAALMTLTNGSTLDPAKLGSTNVTIRANLSTAQGSVTLQYDGASNTKTKPPYTAFGTDSNPYQGAALTPGSHTIKATTANGSSLTVTFTVAGNSTRVIAGYRSDFKTGSPAAGWNYLWNASGPITSASNYASLNWSPVINRYSANGFPVSPDNSSTLFPYGGLTSSGGHPGRGTTQGATYDRFPIAAYTAKLSGYYGISSSFVTSGDSRANGGQVMIFTETTNGTNTVFTQKYSGLYIGGATLNFDQNVGFLNAGDTVYVAVGPNTNDAYDSFTMDFSIAFLETGNPLP